MQYFKRFMANEFEVWINLSNVFYCSSIKKGTERTYPTLSCISVLLERKVTMLACVNLWRTVKAAFLAAC